MERNLSISILDYKCQYTWNDKRCVCFIFAISLPLMKRRLTKKSMDKWV